MSHSRKVEIFSAGCGLCDEAIELVEKLACPSCDVTIQDMASPETLERARQLGVRTVPAVAIDDKLVACCSNSGPNESELKAAGLGQD